MKYFRILILAAASFYLLSCADDGVADVEVPSEMEEPQDQDVEEEENDNDGQNDDEVMLSQVNAFPNLSFSQPLDLQSPNDDSNRIYIAEKQGTIKVFDNNPEASTTETFLDLGSISTDSEQGLLGFAFHPNFNSNGFFYIYYTPVSSVARVCRFRISESDSGLADPSSETLLLEIPQPETNHNGGQLAFGPDGYLYIAVGDGGGAGDTDGNAQNRTNLLGNILRIDVDNIQGDLNYSIPADNPFVDEPDLRSEIFAYGFRNPWRMSFDTQTDKLWVGDVGQNKIEEIDIIELGGNYGWNFYEGTECFSGDCNDSGLIDPIFEYQQSSGDRSITGGYVYRGTENPSIIGKYIYGDFVSGRIWALDEDGSTNRQLAETGLGIVSFGTDADQELYFCAFDGNIYKFEEN
ncbi:hypothetical protein LCGC14_1161450 [marine sediment metagenome]